LRFASELKNRLLHIFRLEAKASLSGPAERARKRKSREVYEDGLRIQMGGWPLRACETWKEPVYAADGTLALLSAADGHRSSEARYAAGHHFKKVPSINF
jgi:hypothetical protein